MIVCEGEGGGGTPLGSLAVVTDWIDEVSLVPFRLMRHPNVLLK